MPEHLTVNQGVTGSSPVGGAKLKEPRLVRGSFNLIPPFEHEPVSLSRDSQQPVGRLTHTLTFPRSGMRSFRPQGKVMVQTRKASLNRLITGCHNAHPISTEEPRLVRGSFNLIPPSEPEPVSLSRDSQQPVVGRLTGLDRFSGLNLHLDALLVRTNGLIQGVTTPPPISTEEPRLVRGSFNLIPPSEPEPAILSRDSQQPVGRLTHTLTFPRSGMRSL